MEFGSQKNTVTQDSNVVELQRFRELKSERDFENRWNEYFKILSFSELMNESSQITHEIMSASEIGQELTQRSILILKELQNRICIDSQERAKDLGEKISALRSIV